MSSRTWIERLGGPIGVLAGQEAAVVWTGNLGLYERIHLTVHRKQQVAMLLRLSSQVLHLIRVRLKLEELDIVLLEDSLQGPRLIVLFG